MFTEYEKRVVEVVDVCNRIFWIPINQIKRITFYPDGLKNRNMSVFISFTDYYYVLDTEIKPVMEYFNIPISAKKEIKIR